MFLGQNLKKVLKNTVLLYDSRKVCLEAITDGKYVFMSRQLNSGQNHSIKLDHKLFGNVAVTYQNGCLKNLVGN
jgi:hypothetical protein